METLMERATSEHRCPVCNCNLIQTFNRLDCPQSMGCGWPGATIAAAEPLRLCTVTAHTGNQVRARFHQWDNGYAIIEYLDGTCDSIQISAVRFDTTPA